MAQAIRISKEKKTTFRKRGRPLGPTTPVKAAKLGRLPKRGK